MNALSRVTCKIPGSTSNCGSGFDTLGLALSIYNWVTVERTDAEHEEEGNGHDIFVDSEMARETVDLFFQESRIGPFEVKTRIRGDVPRARGLGSSVTVRGGILGGLARLAGLDWSRRKLVELITRLEGHPDNASASLLGGFTVSQFGENPGIWRETMKFEIGPEARFVVVSPDFEVLTSSSRSMLPREVPFGEVVSSVNGAACLVAAIASGKLSSLQGTAKDRLHEPYRLERIPGGAAAIRAGMEAGAYTGWLSGSGSSVLCVSVPSREQAVAEAMQEAFREAGLESVARDLSADNAGLVVEEEE